MMFVVSLDADLKKFMSYYSSWLSKYVGFVYICCVCWELKAAIDWVGGV